MSTKSTKAIQCMTVHELRIALEHLPGHLPVKVADPTNDFDGPYDLVDIAPGAADADTGDEEVILHSYAYERAEQRASALTQRVGERSRAPATQPIVIEIPIPQEIPDDAEPCRNCGVALPEKRRRFLATLHSRGNRVPVCVEGNDFCSMACAQNFVDAVAWERKR
jgi:hypothetical protein